MTAERRQTLRKVAIGVLGVAIFAGLAALGVIFLEGDSMPKRHVVTTITTVKLPPPPPPPPPPPQEKPPEPQKIEEPKIKEPDPIKPEVRKPDPLPSPPPLGLGFQGEGGPGGYGDIGVAGGGTGVGGGSGTRSGPGDMERWYAGVIVGDLEKALQRDERTRRRSYRVVIQVWLDGSGGVTRTQLVSSSGDAEQDRAILAVVDEHVFREPLPAGARQPIQIRLGGRRPT
jgi:TonB family protein